MTENFDGPFACANIDEWCYCPSHNKVWKGTPKQCCEQGRYMTEGEERIWFAGRNEGYEARVIDEINEGKLDAEKQ